MFVHLPRYMENNKKNSLRKQQLQEDTTPKPSTKLG
jgi:hypothetical protein